MADERMTGADLDRPRSFRILTEELHFTRAAARLHPTQPALSQQVRALEHQLGAELARRDARGYTLTEVGYLVAAEAQRLLAMPTLVPPGGLDGRRRLAYTRSARGGRARALTMPGVRLRRFATPIPTVDTAPAYQTNSTNPAVYRLAALLA